MATVDVACSKDAIVRSPSHGSGQDSHNVAGAEAGETLYSLLDFAALPSITSLTSAKLFMTRAPSGVHDNPDTGAGVRVQQITGAWEEGNKGGPEAGGEFYYQTNSVDWANKPTVSPTIIAGGSQPSAAEVQWSVTITAIVQNWLNTPTSKKGIQVRSSNDVLDICFHSRHNTNAAKRPFLRLEYSTNTAPKAPTVVLQGTI